MYISNEQTISLLLSVTSSSFKAKRLSLRSSTRWRHILQQLHYPALQKPCVMVQAVHAFCYGVGFGMPLYTVAFTTWDDCGQYLKHFCWKTSSGLDDLGLMCVCDALIFLVSCCPVPKFLNTVNTRDFSHSPPLTQHSQALYMFHHISVFYLSVIFC